MTQMVSLVIDEQAIRQKLRFAFANHDTAVQELIQNARRAGASRVDITYDADTGELTVQDDGSGIEDFAVLMRAGVSGWDDTVAAAEKPYGLGFLAAIYAAKHVSVKSRGKCLAFDTELALGQGAFATTDADTGPGTTITLTAFSWKSPTSAIRRMAYGYPIPITYNGEELPRPDAVSDNAHTTPVGKIALKTDTYRAGHARIYLQGFQVKDEHTYSIPSAVVHLDATRYLGKFPDRNVVIDEPDMLGAVDQQLRLLHEKRLAEMLETLTPLQFCEQAHGLAASLGRLDVFNDIDVAPASWFRAISDMPFNTWNWERYTSDLPEGQVIRKADVEAGTVRVCRIEAFDTSEEGNQLPCLFAWKDGQIELYQRLSQDHWLMRLADVDFNSEVELKVVGPGKAENVPSRANCIWGDIQLCEAVELTANGRTVRIDDHAIGVWIEAKPRILVPHTAMECAFPDESTLKQIESYYGNDDEELEDDLRHDTEIVCAKVRDMITESPIERAAMALERALRPFYEDLRGFSCHMVIDQKGKVTVTNLAKNPAETQG